MLYAFIVAIVVCLCIGVLGYALYWLGEDSSDDHDDDGDWFDSQW